jgi:hypothetical protein
MTLRINRHQMESLREAAVEDFVRRAAKHLRATCPESLAGRDSEALLSLVRDGVRKAAGYRIRAERDVVRYIELMVSVQPDFDQLPAVRAIRPLLTHPGYPGSSKVERLQELEQQGLLRTEPEEVQE